MPSRSRRAAPPADLASFVPRAAEVRLRLEAEVRCYLCAHTLGTLRCAPGPAIPSAVGFVPAGAEDQNERSVVWRRLRCDRCQGPIYLEEPRTVRQHLEHVNWALDRPRRGRPPRWLVDLRGQDAA